MVKAEFAPHPSFVLPNKTKNKARVNGLLYEKKTHAYIAERLGEQCVLAPWIKFISKNNPKRRGADLWCQPDALILDIRQGEITIIEIKLKHTSDAWWQVRRLYIPVVRNIFGDEWTYRALEIVKWFDADTKFPERFDFLDFLTQIPQRDPEKFYVHVWNGRG